MLPRPKWLEAPWELEKIELVAKKRKVLQVDCADIGAQADPKGCWLGLKPGEAIFTLRSRNLDPHTYDNPTAEVYSQGIPDGSRDILMVSEYDSVFALSSKSTPSGQLYVAKVPRKMVMDDLTIEARKQGGGAAVASNWPLWVFGGMAVLGILVG